MQINEMVSYELYYQKDSVLIYRRIISVCECVVFESSMVALVRLCYG